MRSDFEARTGLGEHIRKIPRPAQFLMIAGMTGMLAAADYPESSNDRAVSSESNVEYSSTAIPTPLANTADNDAASSEESYKDCTSIRKKANDIQFGVACASKGDKALTVDGGYLEKGWVYSVISVRGIYKCGFIRQGSLPKLEYPRPRAYQHCQKYYEPLVNDRFAYFKRYNCPEITPGLEGCRDGTYPRRKSERCSDNRLFRNFATDEPSPLNVFGTDNGGFSDAYDSKTIRLLRYRVKVKLGSEDGGARVVRDNEWGLVASDCVDKNDQLGGTPTELSSQQKKNPKIKRQLKKILSLND